MRARVFVGNLSYSVTRNDLEDFFRDYGIIKEFSMKTGYAFLEFEDFRDADDAVYEMNGKELMGRVLRVEYARGTDRSRRVSGYGSRRSERYEPSEYRLIVKNLSSKVNSKDLKDYMRQAGIVTHVDAHKKRRNEGVVEFISSYGMRAAIVKLDGTELNGRKIRLYEDRGRRRCSTSSSSSRSRSRSRSRWSSRSHSSSLSSLKLRKSASRSKSRSRSIRKTKTVHLSKSRSGSESSLKKERSRSRSMSQPQGGSASKKVTTFVSKERSRSSSSSMGKSMSKSRTRSMSLCTDDGNQE